MGGVTDFEGRKKAERGHPMSVEVSNYYTILFRKTDIINHPLFHLNEMPPDLEAFSFHLHQFFLPLIDFFVRIGLTVIRLYYRSNGNRLVFFDGII